MPAAQNLLEKVDSNFLSFDTELPSFLNCSISSMTQLGNKLFPSFGSLRNHLMALVNGQYYWAWFDKHNKLTEYFEAIKECTLICDPNLRHIPLGFSKEIVVFSKFDKFAQFKPTYDLKPGDRLIVTDTSKLILTQTQYEIWGDYTECFTVTETDEKNKLRATLKPGCGEMLLKKTWTPERY